MNWVKYKNNIFISVRFWFTLVVIIWIVLQIMYFSNFPGVKAQWWPDAYRIFSSMLEGAIVSFLLYFLVVVIPERRMKHIIKEHFMNLYKNIKKDILCQVIQASIKGGRDDLATDKDAFERLLTFDGFRNAFQGGREANEGFYAFENHISDDVQEYSEIIFNLKLLSKEINYVVQNYTFERDEVYTFLKRLEIHLVSIDGRGPSYDEVKPLSRLLWGIFAGWDDVDGYRDYDVIERMINDI